MTEMTRTERAELTKLVNRWERVAKSAANERSAELLADFEAEVARTFRLDDDEVWTEAAEALDRAIEETNAKVAERCEELGIRREFAPQIVSGRYWRDRGENAANQRRTELRKMATTRVAAQEKAAIAVIERRATEMATRLVAGSLESPDALRFIAEMPEQLALAMPKLSLTELEEQAGKRDDRYDH
jgi:hypothetical protein